MGLYYACRHCGICLGVLPEQGVNMERLGFERLTAEEQREFVTSDSIGNIHVTIICEDCESALACNPSLHAVDYIIQ
ncbi:MAG: anti-sigma-F factor Fin [Bacillus sp. (in: firmicutes)]